MSERRTRTRSWILLFAVVVVLSAMVALTVHLSFPAQDSGMRSDRRREAVTTRGREPKGAARAFVVQVFDPLKRPIPGAEVTLRGPNLEVLAHARPTNRTGEFSFECDVVESASQQSIEVRAPGFRLVVKRLSAEDLSLGGRLHVIVLEPTNHIFLTVIDKTGQPLSNMSVVAVRSDRSQGGKNDLSFHAVSGPAGKCEFDGIPPGRWVFRILDPDIENKPPFVVSVREGTFLRLKLVARRKEWFRGQLLDDRGRPLRGAEVRWKVEDPRVRGAERAATSAKTDAMGWFKLPLVSIGVSTALDVRTRTGKQVVLQDVWIRTPARAWRVLGTAERDPASKVSISGRVVDEHGHGLVASVSVSADLGRGTPAGVDAIGPLVTAVRSREDGSFDVCDLKPGAYRLVARMRGLNGRFSPRLPHVEVLVPSIPASGLVLQIVAGSMITGTVLDERRKPVSGLMLRARIASADAGAGTRSQDGLLDATTTTDRAGAFAFPDLARGRFRIFATSPVHGQIPHLNGGDQVLTGSSGVELLLGDSCVIQGSVRSTTDHAVVGVRVLVIPKNRAEPTRDAVTKADGAFQVTGLSQGVDYTLAVAFDDGSSSVPIKLETPHPGPVNVVIDGGHELSATVRFPDGKPVQGRRFWVRNRHTGRAVVVVTDLYGLFRVFRAKGREYDVEPFRSNASTQLSPGTVRPDAPAELVLEPKVPSPPEPEGK